MLVLVKMLLREHKFGIKHSKFKLYNFIRENGGIDNWDFVLLEDNIDHNLLHDREKYWIKNLKATLNIHWAKVPKSEYTCEYCNNILCSSSSLKNHLKTNKKCLLLQGNNNNNKEFKCSECGFITKLKKKYNTS